MKPKKIYISGKMRGLPREEYKKKFKDVEDMLTKMGYDAINPCNIEHDSDKWEDRILKDLNILKDCDAIFMLENSRDNSNGAMCEYHFAKGMGLQIMGRC